MPVAINPDIKPAGLQNIVLDCTPVGIISRSAILPVILKACIKVYSFNFILMCDKRKDDGQADTAILFLDECLENGKDSFHFKDRR